MSQSYVEITSGSGVKLRTYTSGSGTSLVHSETFVLTNASNEIIDPRYTILSGSTATVPVTGSLTLVTNVSGVNVTGSITLPVTGSGFNVAITGSQSGFYLPVSMSGSVPIGITGSGTSPLPVNISGSFGIKVAITGSSGVYVIPVGISGSVPIGITGSGANPLPVNISG